MESINDDTIPDTTSYHIPDILTEDEETLIQDIQNVYFSKKDDPIITAKKDINDAKYALLKTEKRFEDAVELIHKAADDLDILRKKSTLTKSSISRSAPIKHDDEVNTYMITENRKREAEINLYIAQNKLDLSKSKYEASFSAARRLGVSPFVTINNISGKNAWVVLSPGPINMISSIGIEKIGKVGFSHIGKYKCQQSVILNNTSSDFELDNSQIYYTVYFDCEGRWLAPFIDKRINTRKYNINLLKRHVEMAYSSRE